MVAGFHVPETPLSDVVGRAGTEAPAHMVREDPKLNIGMVLGETVTSKLVVVAHCPAAGVKT